MAAASQGLGETGVVRGRSAPAPEARAVPGNRCTGFRNQIQQVLGWKKGIKQLAAAGESRPGQPGQSKGAGSELGTRSGLGNTGLEQGTQFVPVKGGGSEPGIQFATGKVGRSGKSQMVFVGHSEMEQRIKPVSLNLVSQSNKQLGVDFASEKTSSVLDLGKRLTEVTQPALEKNGDLEQVTQDTMGERVGLEQVTQATLGMGGGLKYITQSALDKSVIQFTLSESNNSLEQIIQSTKGESGSLEQVVQSTLPETDGLSQVMQSALSKGGGLEQVTQYTLGKGVGSDQGTQPVDSCSSGAEEQAKFVVSDCESEKVIHCALVNGMEPEQPNPLTKGMDLAPDPRIQSVVGLKLKLEAEAQEEGMSFRSVQSNLSAMHRASRSKERVKPTLFQDTRSAWGKKLEQCLYLPLCESRNPKQQMQPFKCQDVEPPDPIQKAGLEQQIFITLTENLSYISGLCNSVHLADGLQNDQHSPQDGFHLGPSKREWPSRPTVRKRAKSCPGSPAERQGSNRSSASNSSNRVRFADSLGLELTEVRSFDSSEEPTVPAHVLASFSTKEPTEHVVWVQRFRMEFTNPKDDENFSERLNSQKVCLEAVTESELVISGTILVINLAYHKEVTVRYTCTDWELFSDVSALFESNIEGKMDRFTFTLNPSVHMLQPGCGLQFAIKYNVDGIEFWDNNNHSNYRMTYQSLQVTVPNDSKDRTVSLD